MKNSCLNKSPKQRILLQRVFLLVPVLSILLISLIPSGVEAMSCGVGDIGDGVGGHAASYGSFDIIYNDSVTASTPVSVRINGGVSCSWDTEVDPYNGEQFCNSTSLGGEINLPNNPIEISVTTNNTCSGWSYSGSGVSCQNLSGVANLNTNFTAPATAGTYYIPIFAQLNNSSTYNGGSNNCSYTVNPPVTQCNDGVSNGDDDTLADINDPACHSDCDAGDGDSTYVPGHTSELNSSNTACTATVRLTPRQR